MTGQRMDGALSKQIRLSFEFRSSFEFSTSSVVCLLLNSLITFANLGPDLANLVGVLLLEKGWSVREWKKRKEKSVVQPFYCHSLPKFDYYICLDFLFVKNYGIFCLGADHTP